jgi:predicted phosphodiesterase
MFHYLYNYLYLFLTGNKRTHLYYQKALARLYPQADVIIYGHTHFAVDEMMDGHRFINPGTGLPQARNHFTLQYSLMLVAPDGTLQVLPRQITPSQP